MYENENVIGRVLKKWLDSGDIKRDELFIVTKVRAVKLDFFLKLFLNIFKYPTVTTDWHDP